MGNPAAIPASPLVTSTAVVCVAGLIVWAIAVVIRVRRARWRSRAESCVCGYSYAGLDLPRCPECGRAIGFNKTFGELGVSEQEVMEHVRRRAEELRDKPLPEEAREALRLLGEAERDLRLGDLPAGVAESLRVLETTGKKPPHEQGPPPTQPA